MNTQFAVSTQIMTFLTFKDGVPASSEHIAGHLNTNAVVVRRLLALLKEAGLVNVHMGAQGGATLQRPAREISLRDIYEAIQPADSDLFALHAVKADGCSNVAQVILQRLDQVFGEAEEAMKESLAQVTVQDIYAHTQRAMRKMGGKEKASQSANCSGK
jgi:Rrf2 family protein